MNTLEIKRTPVGKSYWNNEGAYEKETNELYEELVPLKGEAETVNGELIRIAHRLYHEYCNNGNGNARDEQPVESGYSWYSGYDDEDEDEYEVVIAEYWEEMIDYLRNTIHDKELDDICDRIKEIILSERNTFDDEDMHTYDDMMDITVHYVLTHENKSR